MRHPRLVVPLPLRRLSGLCLAGALSLAAACSDGDGVDPQRSRGQSDFQSMVGNAALPGGGQSAGNESGRGPGNGGAAPGVSAPLPPPSIPGATPGDSIGTPVDPGRLVEEGDVVKLVGPTLYVLNEFRGLQVVDVTNPDAPVLLSRAAGVLGRPEDMFIRGTTAIALVSDHIEYSACAGCPGGVKHFQGSLAAFIDIANPRAVTVKALVEIAGTISDSRIVGDALYVVSQQYAVNSPSIIDDGKNATTVQAFGILDPGKPVARGKLEIPRGGWQNHVHFTDKLLYLASSGYGTWINDACVASEITSGGSGARPPTGSVPAMPGTNTPVPTPPPMTTTPPPMTTPPPVVPPSSDGPCSRITAVDIAAPDGALTLGAHVDVPGLVMDRWSMDHHAGVLRVVGAPQGNGVPRITTYKAGSAAELTTFGPGLDVPVTRPEELKAVRFDGTRAFVVTFQRIDPLFIIDLSNPEAPRKLGELETPGWVDFIEPRGDRLVALGHDQAAVPLARGGWVLSASIYDVSDLTQPRLMSRELFGESGATIPDQRDNWHKVFRVFDEARLIVMPYRTYLPRTPTSPFGGDQMVGQVQLLDFDLPTGKVQKRGSITHDSGIERALFGDDRVLALSPAKLQIIDVKDRSAPRTRGVLDLTRNVREALAVGSDVVTVSDAVSESDSNQAQTTLHLTGAGDPNAAVTKSALTAAVVAGRAFADGSLVYLLGRQPPVLSAEPGKGPVYNDGARLLVVDTAGGTLRARGQLDLPRIPAIDQTPMLGNVPLAVALVGKSLVLTMPRESCGSSGSSGGVTTPPTSRPPAPSTPAPPVTGGGAGGGSGSAGTTAPPDGGVPVNAADAAIATSADAPPAMSVAASALAEVDPKAPPACPPHEADFLVVDLRNPDAPVIGARFLIPGASDVIGAAVVDGSFYVDHFEQIPGFDSLNRVIVAGVRYFVTRVDLTNPFSVQLGPKINVPGIFVGERTRDRSWFTVELGRHPTTGAEQNQLHALYQPPAQAKAYLESSLALDGNGSGRLVLGADAAFGVFGGRLVTFSLADPRQLAVAARTDLPGVMPGTSSASVGAGAVARGGEQPVTFRSGWAAVGALHGDSLVVHVNGGSLIYDVKDPVRPVLRSFVRGPNSGARLHPSTGGTYLPAGRYGAFPVPAISP
jgi:hypothetical protein